MRWIERAWIVHAAPTTGESNGDPDGKSYDDSYGPDAGGDSNMQLDPHGASGVSDGALYGAIQHAEQSDACS